MYLQELVNFHLSVLVEVHLVKDFMERVFINVDIDALQRIKTRPGINNSQRRKVGARKGKLTSKTCWTSTVVMNPFFSLSNLWKRFWYLSHGRAVRLIKQKCSLTAWAAESTLTWLPPGSPGWSPWSWSAVQNETGIPSLGTKTSWRFRAPPGFHRDGDGDNYWSCCFSW